MSDRRAAFQAIGTRWTIQIDEHVDEKEWSALLSGIRARIGAFDRAYSRFRSDSLVTRMSKETGTFELPGDGYAMLEFYKQLYDATNGKVTPLIGQVIADAGYDADYSFRGKVLRQAPRWEDVLAYDRNTITLRHPALLDFGAAGKGYLVDIVSSMVQQAGIHDYLIDAGGDILHRSSADGGIEVGLESPTDVSEAIGVVRLSNRSLCASAGNKRQWEKFHHIIDPMVLRSPDRIVATWVIAADTMTADGLATALFFTPAESLQARFKFSYALLDRTMNLYYAKGFPVNAFAANL